MAKRSADGADPIRLSTGADTPEGVRRQLIDEVRRKLAAGELDSDQARVETALALLDSDAKPPR